MSGSLLLGFVLVVIAGLGTGCCGWPMRLLRTFRFEQCWFIAMLLGLVVIPWVVVLTGIPQPFAVYAEVGSGPLVGSNLFAVAWGFANVLAGICTLRIGFTLTGSILTGVGMIVSVMTPMVFPGYFSKAPELTSWAGVVTLVAVAVALVGVVFSALAGLGREQAIRTSGEPRRWASGGFVGGLILTVMAGVLSAGMQLANAYGHDPIVDTVKAHGVSLVPSEMAFWAAGLFGGALVNVLYPAVLMTARRTWHVIGQARGEIFLSALIGLQLMLAFALYGYGRMQMGPYGDAQAPGIQLPMQIIGGIAVGFLAGEWRGVGRKPLIQIGIAIVVLIAGAILMRCV